MNARVNGHSAVTDRLNPLSVNEVIVFFKDGEASTEYMKDVEVELSDGRWVTVAQGFRDHDIITDNYNIDFREPEDEIERERGYYV